MLRYHHVPISLATALCYFLSFFIRIAVAIDYSSVVCLTAPGGLGAKAVSTTTLHKSTTSTELKLVEKSIVYTVTRQVPDHTITEHTKIVTTTTLEGYHENFTTTVWDGTWTESFPRPTITITLPSIPRELRKPFETHTSTVPDWRARARRDLPPRAPQRIPHYKTYEELKAEAQGVKLDDDDAGALLPSPAAVGGLVKLSPDTVVCNTIHYTSRTLTLTTVTDVVNSGIPLRTIYVLMTHTETSTAFATPPATMYTRTAQRHYKTYTTTFKVVTAGLIPPETRAW